MAHEDARLRCTDQCNGEHTRAVLRKADMNEYYLGLFRGFMVGTLIMVVIIISMV